MSARLERRAAVARLLAARGEAVVVSGLGAPTWDVAALGENARNLHLYGAMGGAAAMGLGLALARPDTPVIVVTGDGEMLMGLGSLAVIAGMAAKNLAVVVLDNGEYGETGGQPTHTAGKADLAAMARAAGIEAAETARTQADLDALAPRLTAGEGPLFAVVKIAPGAAPRGEGLKNATRDAAFNRERLRRALGLPPM